FEDNPTEANQTTVERLVEETCPSSPTPILIQKKKAKKLEFPGPTIQDSEDGAGLRGRIDPSKGKRKGKIPSGTESTQGSASSQRQVPEMPMISEPELELSMSDSNRYKSHKEGSYRHLNEPVQELYTVYKEKHWKIKDHVVPCQKEGGNQGRSPSNFYQQAPTQPTSPRREEEQEKKQEKTIFFKLQDSKNLKRCNGQCFQHNQNLYGIQGEGGAKNETTSFPKEITLSHDVINTFKEIKNSILPLKEIKYRLLSLQEINNSLSSSTKTVVQNKKEIYSIKFIVENNKPKVLTENTQKLIQGQQELYKYIKYIKDKTLTITYDVSIDNLIEKLNKLSISVEKFEDKTSSHQKLLLENVEKSDEARMNLKDDIKSEIRLITEKMDKISEANLNMPSTPFSPTTSTVKPKEEITNKFMKELIYQGNNQVLMKEAPQLKEWPTFTGVVEYDHMSFIKTIDMLQENYAIPDELITARLHSLFEKSAEKMVLWHKANKWQKYLVLVETRNNHQVG
ncbi:hypothetical protein O181_047414, partial [Austropuccinia psidii MF-1]|nr:hypothetical protein [Austropuccinia psidii MF-1]